MDSKCCNVCGLSKPLEEFDKNSRLKGGAQRYCKECRKAICAKHYLKHKDHIRVREQNKLAQNLSKYRAWKATLRCLKCGEAEAICLDLHHLDPTEKEYSVSSMARLSFRAVLREAAKCVVLCRNCHAKVHAGVIMLGE